MGYVLGRLRNPEALSVTKSEEDAVTTAKATSEELSAESSGALARKPLPRITSDNRPFWEGCRQHKIMLPWCGRCDRPHWPPGQFCPFCFAETLTWRRASGRGTISSWVIVHKAWLAEFEADIPYNAVQVELEEGVRLTGNLVSAPNASLRVGLLVEVAFDDVTPEVTLPRFKPR